MVNKSKVQIYAFSFKDRVGPDVSGLNPNLLHQIE